MHAAREAGDHARALALLAEARATQPRAAWPWLEEVGVHRDRGDKEQAYATVRSLLEREPSLAKAWLQLGLLERANGAAEAALAAFEQAHALDPDSVEPVLQLAQETFNLGQQKRSDALLEQALRLDTDGVQALSLCAQRAMMANDAAAALPLFERAMQRCPWHVNSYIGASNALVKLGRTDTAMQTLDRGITQCGSRPGLHARRSQLLRDMGFYTEALAVAEHGLTLHPDSLPLWETIMRLQILVGDEADMRAWLARAAPGRDSDRATVAFLAGEMAAELGDPTTALGCYQRAAALAPTAARMHGAMAVASLTRFDIDAASAHLQRQTEMTAPALRLKSRSDNPQQSYYGQIINEFRLDPEPRAALATLPLESAPRIEALYALCRSYPDSTLLAAALIDALWRARVINAGGGGGTCAIPQQIAQFWDTAPPPDDVLSIMQSWSELNPGYTHDRFDDLRARAFLHAHYAPEVLIAYHRATLPAMKADLFRLAWLAQCGGVYGDADDRCTTPVAELLTPGASLVLYREYLGTLGNNFLAATAGHPVITTALHQAVTAINRGDQEILWLSTGPGLITRSFAQALARDAAGRPGLLAGTRIWQRREILRHISIHCLAGYKDTAQHWIRAAFTTPPSS